MSRRGFTIIELLVVISIIGLISSVALANLQSAKGKAEIAASKQFDASVQHTLGSHAVATWEFNEGAGVILGDSADGSGALNGTIGNAVWVADTGLGTNINDTALSFNANSYVSGSNFPNPGNNGDVTVSMWVKPSSIAGNVSVFYVGDDGDGAGNCTSFEMQMRSGQYWSKNNNEEKAVSAKTILSNNVWHHVVYAYDQDGVTGYHNGDMVGQTPAHTTSDCSGALNNPEGKWSIGAVVNTGTNAPPPGNPKQYKGLIDSLRVYNGTLSATEIRKIYAEESKEKAILVSL